MSDSTRLRFTGTLQVQFVRFLQGLMQTEPDGSQAFVGVVQGFFGNPPNGTLFEARVKLTLGANLVDDASKYWYRLQSRNSALIQISVAPHLIT